MKNTAILILVLAISLLGFRIATAHPDQSQQSPQSGYEISWYAFDGGGETTGSGAGYSLRGSAGEPDAGVMSGGPYTLNGGFWSAAQGSRVYLPLASK